MDGNPFEGTPFEQDWMNGLNAGLVEPNAEITAPSPLDLNAQDAFNQGVQAGQSINAALQPTIPIEGGFQAVSEHVHEGIDIAGPIVAAWREATSVGFTLARLKEALGAAAPEILFNLVVLVAIWGPRRDSFFSDVVAGRLEEIRQSLANSGTSDNLELFMAVCADSQHSSLSSDVVTELGVWHGLFRLEFAEAQADAAAHEHPESVLIHRYQTATPTMVEVLSP